VLLAALQLAATTGADTHTWQLAWALHTFLDRRGHWHYGDQSGEQPNDPAGGLQLVALSLAPNARSSFQRPRLND
jgi:hypothetical protein